MINLQQNTLLREIPSNLLVDDKVVHMANALQIPLGDMLEWAEKINYKMNLDILDEAIIDHLLWESHITWNEGLNMATTKEQKINLVKSSVKLHRLKGTPAAISLVLDALNFNGEVQEWFEYEGRPYFFRLITEQALSPTMDIDGLITMINEFKNVRSWLENITVLRKINSNLYFGAAYVSQKKVKITLPSFKMDDLESNIHTGLINTSYKKSSLNIKDFEMSDSSDMQLQTGLLQGNYKQTKIDLSQFLMKDSTNMEIVTSLVQGNYKRTKIGMPLFSMADNIQAPSLFGGVFSSYKKTTILQQY